MPTYEFKCSGCGSVTDHRCSFQDKPRRVWCECGDYALPIISLNTNSFVKDRPFEFNKKDLVVNFGKDYGRTPDQQHRRYQEIIGDMQKQKRAARTSGRKQDIEWLGTMPGEMVDSIGLHEGDPEAVVKNPVDYLKRTGLYEGN